MKNKKLLFLAITLFWSFASHTVIAQNCIQCDENCNPSGNYSSVMGMSSTASADMALAGGYNSHAHGAFSIAYGNQVLTNGANSFAFGRFVEATATSAMVFGSGFDLNNKLKNNNTSSLMIGFNSNVPTFLVEGNAGLNRTGRIGIGNVTAPQAKLHIRADENYDTASVFIQASNDERPAYLWLGTKSYGLQKQSTSLEFLSDGDYLFDGGNVGIGTNLPQAKIQVKDGDIFIEDIDRGIIMKSPDGNCWRGTVNNQGQMQFEQIDCQTLETGTQHPENYNDAHVKIYPNPADNQVFISFDETLGKLQLEISDINGRLISNQKLRNSQSSIDLSTFQPGTYLFRLIDKSGKQVAAEKVIKE